MINIYYCDSGSSNMAIDSSTWTGLTGQRFKDLYIIVKEVDTNGKKYIFWGMMSLFLSCLGYLLLSIQMFLLFLKDHKFAVLNKNNTHIEQVKLEQQESNLMQQNNLINQEQIQDLEKQAFYVKYKDYLFWVFRCIILIGVIISTVLCTIGYFKISDSYDQVNSIVVDNKHFFDDANCAAATLPSPYGINYDFIKGVAVETNVINSQANTTSNMMMAPQNVLMPYYLPINPQQSEK